MVWTGLLCLIQGEGDSVDVQGEALPDTGRGNNNVDVQREDSRVLQLSLSPGHCQEGWISGS